MKAKDKVIFLEGALHYAYLSWQRTKSKRDWEVYSQISHLAEGMGLSGPHIWASAFGKRGKWSHEQIKKFSTVLNFPNAPGIPSKI